MRFVCRNTKSTPFGGPFTTLDFKVQNCIFRHELAILNQSPQPVYQVIVNLVLLPRGHDDKVQEGIDSRSKGCLSTVPPGQGYTSLPYPGAGMFRHFGIEIGFKDAAGRSWVRKANGDLLEIKIPPIEYYRINLPVSWAVPEKEIAEDSYPDTEQDFTKIM